MVAPRGWKGGNDAGVHVGRCVDGGATVDGQRSASFEQ